MLNRSHRIEKIKFALLSPDENRKMSQIRVITPDTYDDDGYPIERGLMDLHMDDTYSTSCATY